MNINSVRMTKLKEIASLVFVFTVIFLFLTGCNAEPTPETFHVGIISGLSAFNPMADGFKAGMAELGYIEGENITYDMQAVTPGLEELLTILEQFEADGVDLIFVYPGGATQAVKEATKDTDIPVVFGFGVIEDGNLVASVREPSGNITGVRFPGPELIVSRLELLLEMVPEAKRILLFHNPNYRISVHALEALEEIAASSGEIEFVVTPISSTIDIMADLQTHGENGATDIDAILIMTEPISQSPDGWAAISAFAAQNDIPIGGSAAYQADGGAIFSYIPDSFETGKVAALSADKILGGIQAGTIPVITPDSHLRINLALAEELGLTVNDRLLNLAADIIREQN